jgi:hypothetical protein
MTEPPTDLDAELESLAQDLDPPAWHTKPFEEWTHEETDAFMHAWSQEAQRGQVRWEDLITELDERERRARDAGSSDGTTS